MPDTKSKPASKRGKQRKAGSRPALFKARVLASSKKRFPIVGIGASAGGLEGLTDLFRALPAKPGMAFVVMQHLSPVHESALTTLLGRAAAMPVVEARHNQPIEADRAGSRGMLQTSIPRKPPPTPTQGNP